MTKGTQGGRPPLNPVQREENRKLSNVKSKRKQRELKESDLLRRTTTSITSFLQQQSSEPAIEDQPPIEVQPPLDDQLPSSTFNLVEEESEYGKSHFLLLKNRSFIHACSSMY
jgi:hypothetical protein